MDRSRIGLRFTGLTFGVIAVVLVIGAVALGFGWGRVSSSYAEEEPAAPSAGASSTGGTGGGAGEGVSGHGSDLYAAPADLPGLIDTVVGSTILVRCGGKDEGSGVVLDASPLSGQGRIVVTNEHVIEGCEKNRTVRINAQGARLKGTVVAWDVTRDLAILEVPDLTLPPLAINTDTARGQWAMAAGAPMGYRNSISVGVISAVVPNESTVSTDAVIGPGSSGGPLVNSRGEVVGINAAVWKDAEGISLATQVGALCMKVLECSSDE